tara:strand:+ start:47 stop:685 length:639 start_codon:yes stop_codon:yes gene_type:complete
MFWLFLRVVISGNFIFTALSIWGHGTCSFGGSRAIRVQTNLGDSGAISCSFAAMLILIAVLGYWLYILRDNTNRESNSINREVHQVTNYKKWSQNLNNEDKVENIKNEDLDEDVEISVPISSNKDIDTTDLNYERTEEDMLIFSSEKLSKLKDEFDELINIKEKKELQVKKINDFIAKKNEKDKEKSELIEKIKETERRISEIDYRDKKDNE